jgi:phosphoglycolate phosphatase
MENNYHVVLLDMDGTFLNSRGAGTIPNEWAYNAFKKTLNRYGLTLSREEIDAFFLNPLRLEGEEGVRKFCKRFGLECEEFWARREQDVIDGKIEAIRRGDITLCKGSEGIIKYLNSKCYLAVVSDSQQACVDYALEHFHLKPYFTIWFGRRSDLSSLDRRKPTPFYINKVLKELHMHRDEAILVDDSPVGILAAHNAGIDSVLIGTEEKVRQYQSNPTFLIQTIGDLKRIL